MLDLILIGKNTRPVTDYTSNGEARLLGKQQEEDVLSDLAGVGHSSQEANVLASLSN